VKARLGVVLLLAFVASGCDDSSRKHATTATTTRASTSSGLAVEAAPQAITSIELAFPPELPTPAPVRTTDGRYHLVYQLSLVNLSPQRLDLKRVDVLDRSSGGVVAKMKGAELRKETARVGSVFPIMPTASLGGDQAGILFIDLSFGRVTDIPSELAHEIVYSQVPVSANLSTKVAATRVTLRTTGAPFAPGAGEPFVVLPPLRGSGWGDQNGCCRDTAHFRVGQTFDGVRFNPERFGIDFIRYDEGGAPYHGDPKQLKNWLCWGAPVVAVADGKVISAVDRFPDNKLLKLPGQLTPGNIAGNKVVIELGGGRFAAYAHLRRGSVRVRAGDHVKAGQVIGELGNSGASGIPHLHFQVMDRPSFLASEGLPYVYDSFELEGRIVPIGNSLSIKVEATPGPRRRINELPLFHDLVRFPE
jgi:hypothetical protein